MKQYLYSKRKKSKITANKNFMNVLWYSIITTLNKLFVALLMVISVSGFAVLNNLRQDVNRLKSTQNELTKIVPQYYTLLFEFNMDSIYLSDSIFNLSLYYNGKKCKKLEYSLFRAYENKDSIEIKSGSPQSDSSETIKYTNHRIYGFREKISIENISTHFSYHNDTVKIKIDYLSYWNRDSPIYIFWYEKHLGHHREQKILINRIGKKEILIEYGSHFGK